MAERARAVAENVPGAFFVDETCVDCDTCRQLAPATFGETGESSFVQVQPRDEVERRAALRALVACPTGSIGTAERGGVKAAVDEFPMALADGVSFCGFNSRKSFGGSSYFVEHREGNWLIDAPRFVEQLARRFAERGGVRYIFLTHRDDVADADKYAARFGAERIIHRLELAAQPDAERVIDGRSPVRLAPEFLAIPTPGHTRGHCALLCGESFSLQRRSCVVEPRAGAAERVAGRVLVLVAGAGGIGSAAGGVFVRMGAAGPRGAGVLSARGDAGAGGAAGGSGAGVGPACAGQEPRATADCGILIGASVHL